MRNRILAVIVVAGCVVSTLAHALGLGDIEVYSALNQPLVAEIELSSVRPGETDSMRVKLADEEAFMQAGVERPFYLTKLKFNLAVKPDGTQYINITTTGPIREPFLSFLVDVDWPRGRLVREYTVLLDPPVFAGAQQAPSTQSETQPVATAASAAGAPALIKRDETAATTDEFAFDEQPVEQAASPESVQTGQVTDFEEPETEVGWVESQTDTDDGFGLTEGAEPANLSAGLPDIEITTAEEEATVSVGEDEFATDDTLVAADQGPSEAVEDFSFEESLPAADSGELSYDESTEAYLDESEQPAYQEETPAERPVFSASGSEIPLPDINLFYDASLPYDEEATNALLAQFAAEDEARARGESVAAGAGEHLIESGDTLYDIASRYKAPDVTVNQAMLSILRYNPDAFIRDNINSVRKGFVLRIPDRESMLQIDSTEAMAEVRQQYALWREYRNQLVGAPSTAYDARTSDELTITDSGADADRSAGELSILSPGRDANASARASGAQEGSESGSSLYVDLQLAREQLQAERLEKAELQARLTDLTAQIETQDRMISLQNEQLAQLQQRLSELGDETSVTPTPSIDGVETAETTEPTEPAEPEEPVEVAETEAGQIETGLTLQAEPEDQALPGEDIAALEAEESPVAESLADVEATAEEAVSEAPYKADFETDFEPQLPGDEPLSLQPEAQGEPAEADSEAAAETAAIAEPVSTESKRPEGIAGFVYDFLDPPYKAMWVDFIDTAISTPLGNISIAILIAAGFGALILLLLWLAVKPKKKKPVKAQPVISDEEFDEEEEVHLTVQPSKPSFGERLSSMFAPITGLFRGGKKPSGIAAIAAQADHRAAAKKVATEYPDETESDSAIEDLGEIESFDETAKTAAEQASTETGGRFASTQKSITRPGVAQKPAVVQEELSDDTTQEVDVYLAYGLHDQAEELLTQALKMHPGKVEYRGKLLETYFAAGKKTEFEALAAELHSSLAGRSSRVWDKTIAMGKEIAPNNPLFADVAGSGLKVSDFAPAKPETADLDLSEAQGSTAPDIEFGEDEGAAASTATDFDLDLSEGQEELDDTLLVPPGGADRTEIMSTVDVESAQADIERHDTDLQFDLDADADDIASDLNIDFNADELGLDTEVDVDTSMDDLDSETQVGDDDATVAMEMAFNLDDESAEQDDASIELDRDDSGEINLDDVDSDVFEADGNASDDLLADLDLGSSDGLEAASVDTEFEIPEDDDTIIDADLEDETISGDIGDEVSTKLDLAKAYMDMGDYDGASSTLEEVVAEGDAAQRKEAEELLDQIH
ncbi:MAG: hypothetical protein JXA04_10430 [Gammaproteobacteria bacterium]|nr:hypothetical protein [Gammaproteobacteria bacterium]